MLSDDPADGVIQSVLKILHEVIWQFIGSEFKNIPSFAEIIKGLSPYFISFVDKFIILLKVPLHRWGTYSTLRFGI